MAIIGGLAAAGLAAWGALVLGLYVFQRRILFAPDEARPDPAGSDVPEAVRIGGTTADGLALEGWWCPPPSGRPTVLYLHGNGGNIGDRDGKMRRLVDRGYGVLMAGYRGYGGNPGKPTEAGLIADARAWLATLEAVGVPVGMVVLYGESLGSGVAVALATERAVAGVVLEAPFTAIADIAAERYWFAPVRALVRDPFDSAGRIAALRAPLLIVHGTEDSVVPFAHGRRLFEVAVEPKRFVRLVGGGHTNLFDHGALEALDGFVTGLAFAAD